MEREANKAQQAEQKKLEKQKADWDSGKHALESIVAKIDSAIIEAGSIGGMLNPGKSS
jgi:crossover junction endonuclease EME1